MVLVSDWKLPYNMSTCYISPLRFVHLRAGAIEKTPQPPLRKGGWGVFDCNNVTESLILVMEDTWP
ncbi:MAG: hypothetical protein HW384_81 [Dehalococcoidia bacterium]|nr:hypothetical protein [Dehalococcoidia bacterium]